MPAAKSKKPEKEKEDVKPTLQKGVYIFPDGNIYDGEYFQTEDGSLERSGFGVHLTTEGVKYEGHWAKDKMNGHGTLTNGNGSVYIGEFVDNQFHGKGRYIWPNGSVYEGDFNENRLEGEGRYTDVDKQVWVGSFHNKAAPGLKFVLSL